MYFALAATIALLSVQDYVKWRGLLLFRFLATIVDADASVRSLGAFTLTNPLIAKVGCLCHSDTRSDDITYCKLE